MNGFLSAFECTKCPEHNHIIPLIQKAEIIITYADFLPLSTDKPYLDAFVLHKTDGHFHYYSTKQ